MARKKRVPGSLRSIGVTAVPCDVTTRARLRVMAGDMPVSHYLRAIAFGEIELPGKGSSGSQVPLPGQELLVSNNTLASLGAKIVALESKLAVLFLSFVGASTIQPGEVDSLDSLLQAMAVGDTESWATYVSAYFKQKRSTRVEGRQGELMPLIKNEGAMI